MALGGCFTNGVRRAKPAGRQGARYHGSLRKVRGASDRSARRTELEGARVSRDIAGGRGREVRVDGYYIYSTYFCRYGGLHT